MLNSIGTSFIWPLTTIYMHNALGKSLTEVGVILLMYSIANVIGSYISGRLFDQLNPQLLTLLGVGVSGLAMATLIFLHGWPAYPIGLVAIGFGTGWIITQVNSLGTTIHSKDGRYVFNMLYFMQNLGVVFGTSLVGFVYDISMSLLFVITTVLYVLLFIVVAVYYKVPALAKRRKPDGAKQLVRLPKANNWVIYTFFFTLVIIWIMYEQWVSNLSVYMTGMGIPMRNYSLLWTLNAGLIVIFQLILNRLAHYMKNIYIQVYAGIFFVAISFVTLMFAHDYMHFILAMVILTMGEATAFPAMPAIINELTPVAVKGKYQGLLNSWASFGKAIGPLFGGLVIEGLSYSWLFLIAAIANFGLLILNLIIVHLKRNETEVY
ncbi:MFS transporter [Secundilactobacillus malefermentans]|nr:MFS transporter [Secundilactobacillus malefermentans]QEA32518.1 MFS transporter [Secundilactobacillus malefermentans]